MEETYGFENQIIQIIKNYLLKRTFSVEIEESRSIKYNIKSGVPQGSVLGPVLYNLYLADIPQPENGQLIITFADDILIAATHPK